MDYSLLAGQLLSVQANLLQVPAYQQLSKMVRGEMFVLNYLATHEAAIHPKELSKKMAVSTARITSLLHHMEEKGLVARSSDLSDNRQIFVRLTENGVTAIQKARAEVISRVSSLLEALGPEDAREYIRIQEKLRRARHRHQRQQFPPAVHPADRRVPAAGRLWIPCLQLL